DNHEKHLMTHTGEKLHHCNQCDKNFSLKQNLVSHERTHTGENLFKCSQCDECYSRQSSLNRHITIQSEKDSHGESVNKTECMAINCKETFYHHSKLIDHLKQKHGAVIDFTEHVFENMGKFLEWKQEEESKKYIYFSKETATKENKTKGTSYTYYLCQKNGNSIPHTTKAKRQRKTSRRNRKGVVKQDKFCPSRMIVKVDQAGAVNVTYIHKHNHNPDFKDTEHHPIPEGVKGYIEQKLQLGASVDQIYKSLRGGRGSRESRGEDNDIQRRHAISKRHIREIARKLKVNRRMHVDDAQSIHLIVEKLQKEKYNPVLLYKPQKKTL
ncbi:unnamed protein product, partial [Meganyctiphanes norvegica]